MTAGLTHIDVSGEAHMVDVGDKAESTRTAVAEGAIRMKAETLDAILAGKKPETAQTKPIGCGIRNK